MVNEHSAEQQSIRTKTEDGVDHDRRQLLAAFTTVAGASAMALLSQSAQAQSESTPVPRRALTGRDASGKSVFKSFDVTPQVVTFQSSPRAINHLFTGLTCAATSCHRRSCFTHTWVA